MNQVISTLWHVGREQTPHQLCTIVQLFGNILILKFKWRLDIMLCIDYENVFALLTKREV